MAPIGDLCAPRDARIRRIVPYFINNLCKRPRGEGVFGRRGGVYFSAN